MKYNDKGVVNELEDTEVLKRIFTSQKMNTYFKRLKKEVPWQELTWENEEPQPKLVFRYGELERNIRKYDIIEDLIFLIEESFETTVLGGWGDYYRNGEDHTPYKKNSYSTHTFTFAFGSPRKFMVRDNDEEKRISIKNGDLLHLSPKINKDHMFSVLQSKDTKSSIYFTFYTEKPYIHRTQHTRFINVLGIGRIQVWFQGPAEQFPENAVATILPTTFTTLLGGPRSLGGRLDFETSSPIETMLLREYFESDEEEDE